MCAPTIVRIAHEQAARTGRRGFLGALGVTLSGVTALGAAAVARPARAHAAPPSGVFDLTHPLHPGLPIWPGSPPFTSAAVNTYDNGGFAQNMLAYWEHSGTHLDAPAHRAPGGATTELVRAEDLVAPLVVVDISARAATDADAGLTVDDLERWQSEHGRIPPRAFVAVYSGWESRLTDPAAFLNLDAGGAPHAPGIDVAAAEYLIAEHDIVGVGVDTLSIDHGRAVDYATHTAVLGAGRYGVEMLAGLAAVPPSGATVMVGAPKHVGGSGGPCRVFALV
ncbi:MAG TPA: cyclase family protein [Nocardia sp.]|uniref:cyclase family protein n=1 Tax=Nocardia sp. TaxID=1821 RepID=UPI002B4AC8D7|nr:cyclase family protein [Nocardia sp.]HLS77080.1 cyclase family protein [Nocardia sp.]